MEGKSKKLLFGCAIGCGGLLLLGVGSCVGFSIWIDRPGDLLEPQQLFGPTTTGYLEWTLSEEDPGTRDFVNSPLERSQADPASIKDLPSVLGRFVERQNKKGRDDLQELLPMVAVWTMHSAEAGGNDQHLLSVSIERLGNRMTMMDWTFGLMFRFSPEIATVNYAGERMYVIDSDDRSFTFFIHGQDLFFTTDVENGKLAIDQLTHPATEPVASELGRVFAALPDTALRGVMSNTSGALDGIWDKISGGREDDLRDPPDWTAIRSATLTGGFTGPRSFEGVLELQCNDRDWAKKHAEAFVTALRADYRRSHLPIETTITTQGDRIRIVFQMEDVPGFLDEL